MSITLGVDNRNLKCKHCGIVYADVWPTDDDPLTWVVPVCPKCGKSYYINVEEAPTAGLPDDED